MTSPNLQPATPSDPSARATRVRTTAAAQEHLISYRQLRDLGATDHWISSRCSQGWLVRVMSAVYSTTTTDLGGVRGAWAARLRCGDEAVVSHNTAAALWGLDGAPDGRATVTIPARRSVVAGPLVRVVRSSTLGPTEVTAADGLALTTVPRTLLDLAGEVSRARLRHMIESAQILRIASVDELGRYLLGAARKGRTGSARLAELLDQLGGRESLSQSRLEIELADLMSSAGIDGWVRQRRLPSGPALSGVVDACVEVARVIVEVDSRAWHSRHQAMRSDRQRDFEAAQAGYLTVRFMAEDLRAGREISARGLRQVVAGRAASRPA